MPAVAFPRITRTNLAEFYRLTKPGIIYGNDVAVIGGFLLASRWHIDVVLLIATVLGISLIMASGCVFNNYIDRDIDAKMERTKRRALVEGRIEGPHALVFGTLLYIFGAITLAIGANLLTLGVAAFGFVAYVVFYSLWSKRYSVHSTIIGAFAGAVPPVVGYTAVTNQIDGAVILLFLILMIWQLPHAFAIAVHRLKDYSAASVPVLPVAYGVYVTKIVLLGSIVLFTIPIFLLYTWHYTGEVYLTGMLALCVFWIALALRGFKAPDEQIWGRRMFLFSLIVLLAFCTLIAVDPI